MVLVISPSKTQDFDCRHHADYTVPKQLHHSEKLINTLRLFSKNDLAILMKISDKLANLNWQRYRDFKTPFDLTNAKQALLVFKGDVYNGIDSDHYSDEDFSFAQKHLRILSGLYGVLKPMDLIQPYRLEMGTKLATKSGKDLYEFWGRTISDALNKDLEEQKMPLLINLASNEYFKVIQSRFLRAEVLTLSFKENKNGQYKVIGLYAKKARGLMADFVIKNKITNKEDLQKFDRDGYSFRPSLSNDKEWIFCRS